MSVRTREKLAIIVSVLACCIAIAVFALVSLGRFIHTPDKTIVPVVAKLSETPLEKIDLLEPIPLPGPPAPSISAPTPSGETNSRTLAREDSRKSERTVQKVRHETTYHKVQELFTTLFTRQDR